MRTITATEKHRAVNEGQMSEGEFVRQMRLAFPQHINQFSGYKDSVQILMNRGVLSESVLEKDLDNSISDDSLRRALDIELTAMGHDPVTCSDGEAQQKAKTKALSNLKKDPLHYYNLLAAESSKVDKNDKMKETKPGAKDKDTFNDMKKATLKEGTEVDKLKAGLSAHGRDNEVQAYIDSLNNDIRINGPESYKGWKIEDYIEDMGEYIAGKSMEEDSEEDAKNDADEKAGWTDDPRKDEGSVEDVIDPAEYGDIGKGYLAGFDKPHSLNDDDLETLGRKVVQSLYKGDFKAAKAKFINAGSYEEGSDPVNTGMRAGLDDDEGLADIEEGFNDGLSADDLTDLANFFYGQAKTNDDNEYTDVAHYIKKAAEKLASLGMSEGEASEVIREARRKKTRGGKMVQEADYDTGGYVESMGPQFDKACDTLSKAFGEWADGPMTEPGMVEPAKRDVVQYIDQKLTKQFLEEAKGKDLDGDGDIDKDDYMAAKDQAIKKASGKGKTAVKENLKAIIAKVLEEQVLAEAATAELSKFADDYAGFDGMKSAINGLENVVTDIEQYFDKTRDKIQKIYDTLGEIRNEEGLKVGGFLAPAIEQAFMKDLRPVTKMGFTKGLNQPKVKTISQRDIDNHNSGEVPLGETEQEAAPKQTMFTPVMESKKKLKNK